MDEIELRKICKEYILTLLKLQQTKLECINLGFNKSDTTLVELNLIENSSKFLKEIWK